MRCNIPLLAASLALFLSGCLISTNEESAEADLESTLDEVAQAVTATRDNNLAMGNPSGAGTSNPNNYLMTKPQYVLSYNNARGSANWVSWHLSTAWKGTTPRQDN